jgi:glutamine phosphoribosylpyrophosphate amidotransferase
MMAAAWDRPQPYTALHEWVCTLEIYGLGGFGWGVAWLAEDGKVQVERGLGRYVDEAEGSDLMTASSSRFLVHLRRPNKLSTVQYADTQPFARDGEFAFCHNGFLDRAESLRPPYAERLAGGADSEVGWVFFQDRLDDGTPPVDALREVDETFQGKVNLGYLDRTGHLALYSDNTSNAMWRFTAAGADMVSTAVHSDDDSVFTLVYPQSTDRRLVPIGTAVVLGEYA